MPFPYRYICDLLQQLDDEIHKEARRQIPATTIIEKWFQEHRSRLNAPENDACAILSSLLPEKRTDRVYGIQVTRLQSIIGQALLLGASRVQELRRYTIPGLGLDLADCVENILKRTPNPSQGANELTVEEIDNTLGCIAASCRFSSPAVRILRTTQGEKEQNSSLVNIYRRLSARDAKWFTRLVLKNYQPVVINDQVVFRCYHVLLPQLMRIRDNLTLATAFMRHISQSPVDQGAIASLFKPSLGTKIGRQPWLKGRSIKHCLDMAGSRQMSCQRKIDGEYCQIHVDLRKPRCCIQIFSKSGKDSTQDRVGHRPIQESLKLGTPECPFKLGCILEGELVVYSTKDDKILPFHKIRKHVSRSGSFLGTSHDSQPHNHEHLIIIYYDVLMIDNESLLNVRQSERFRRLAELVTCRKGYAELVSHEVISFARPSAASKLREAFAKCIVLRDEGLVLKPDEPYFDFSAARESYRCCNIKLKKEYVQGWGDVGDFAVVGASYDAAKAREYKLRDLKWTHFFIGCLENKAQARARSETPRFRVTNMVELPEHLLTTFKTQCSPSPVPFKDNQSIVLDFGRREAGQLPTEVFQEPLVFDMRCFSFDKEPNTNFWSMRFPMVSKIHHDRSYLDTITFTELQEIAKAATDTPAVEDSQEMRKWVSALEKADPRGIAVDAMSQQSTSTDTTLSPKKGPWDEESQRISIPESINEDDSNERLSKFYPNNVLLPRQPMTSTRSSAVENTESCSAPEAFTRPLTNPERPKRPIVETWTPNSTSKRQRRHSNASSIQSASTDKCSGPSANGVREPLGQINTNCSSKQRGVASLSSVTIGDLHQPPMLENCSLPLPADSSGLTSKTVSLSPSRAPSKEQNTIMDHNPRAMRQCCLHLGPNCAFANCSILLSPCISGYAWVTDSLLRDHGINDFAVDPQSWSRMPSSAASADTPSSSEPTTKDVSRRRTRRARIRKICLVESRRPEATAAFLQKIEDAALAKKNGKREWIAVYDWRVLESITDDESGKCKSGDADPWRKWYVGIA
ncbi:hypothetical protein F4779DRAFT_626714 [Xylariaceae sp. FL0662B]|nr:hypothetical protein F4779DRAFT_626714 [Xylariaceae sp. FL0662B]